MFPWSILSKLVKTCPLVLVSSLATLSNSPNNIESLVLSGVNGKCGGTLNVSRRSEPRTLNPLIAIDGTSKELISLLMADLIHINRLTQRTEAALAKSWEISPDGRTFTVYLRRGVHFSDGEALDADDVVFTLDAYLDEKTHSPQRDLLIVGGAPISVHKIDQYTLVFTLVKPYAAAERLFDGIAILPRHVLANARSQGRLATAWTVSTPPKEIVGLGAFQLAEYNPGQNIVLRRNPFYWKKDGAGNRLPYLDQIVSVLSSTSEAEELRFQAGQVDVISRFDPQDFSALQASTWKRFRVYDVGPGLEYNFLLLNMNDPDPTQPSSLRRTQNWFSETGFRQAVSLAADRDALVRLGYAGRAAAINVPVSAGNRSWMNASIHPPSRSIDAARNSLRSANFTWTKDNILRDSKGETVEFSILYNAAKPQHERVASILQQDLKEIGIQVNTVPMDQATLIDRVFNRLSYDSAIMTLADGDTDPNTELNVLLSTGTTHLWRLRQNRPPEPWQVEVDRLMAGQMTALNYSERKAIFDRVLDILSHEEPMIYLLSPDILAGASTRVGNFQPAVLSSYTLWNADCLFIRPSGETAAAP